MNESADILLVEDNHINQIVAQQILTKSGYTLETVSDGESAIETLSRRSFRLILMDVQMPGLDGMETTRSIRKSNPPAGTTPIIAMTAYATDEDRQACIDAGMTDYISKPLQLDLFLEKVKTHILPVDSVNP